MKTCLKIDMIICKGCNFRWRTKKEVVLLRFELRKRSKSFRFDFQTEEL